MLLRRKSLLVTTALVLLAGTAGALAGYVLGRVMLHRVGLSRLDRYSAELIGHAESYARELDAITVAVNASQYPFCSNEDLAHMRRLAFGSLIVRDVGRVRGGLLYCSGSLGRLPKPYPMPRIDFETRYGEQVRSSVPLLIAGGRTASITQTGETDIVFTPTAFDGWGQSPMEHQVVIVGKDGKQFAEPFGRRLKMPPGFAARQRWKDQGVFYRARCSSETAFCAIAAISEGEMGRLEPELLTGFVALGGVAGAAMGVLGGVVRRRGRSLARQLQRAIRRDTLEVVYQPVVEPRTGKIVAAEALVRWVDEEGGIVRPDMFVAIAEHAGFVGGITEMVVRRACRELRDLFQRQRDFSLTVNIAAADLTSTGLFVWLESSLSENGILPHQIGLELTERSTADHVNTSAAILELRAHGHKVHIDDFGTGYSSLAYLHELDVDAIKIDKSFTRTVGTEAVTASILPQILSMAEVLGLDVTVEGVETESQASYLAQAPHRVLAQGWYYSHPISAEQLEALVRSDTRLPGRHAFVRSSV
jgi:sensor c-di-GMP phosphodiesterase-like protein